MRLGDVHTVDFESWYEDKINTDAWDSYQPAHIKDGPSAITNDIDICLKLFQDREGRKPTGKELKSDSCEPFEAYQS